MIRAIKPMMTLLSQWNTDFAMDFFSTDGAGSRRLGGIIFLLVAFSDIVDTQRIERFQFCIKYRLFL